MFIIILNGIHGGITDLSPLLRCKLYSNKPLGLYRFSNKPFG